MPAGQQTLRINVGDGAGGGDVHVSPDQYSANGRTRLKRFRLLFFAYGTSTHHGHNSSGGKLRGELADRLFGESVEHQRSFDRLQIIGEILRGARKGGGI